MVWGNFIAHVIDRYVLDADRTLTGSYNIAAIYVQNNTGGAATVTIATAAAAALWIIPFAADGMAQIEPSIPFLADKGLKFSAGTPSTGVTVTVLRSQDGA